MSVVQTEHILVVPTRILHDAGYFQGFTPESDRYLERLLRPENLSYRPRDQMEEDPSFKQLIPYVILQYRDPDGRQSIFQYTRGKGQGEQRLHAKISVGIGGHICSDDHDAPGSSNPYLEGMRRELDEEILLDTPFSSRCVGLINDDETEVGKVHLGIVHVFDVQRPDVQPRERDILDSGFETVDELMQKLDRMESWSRICLEVALSELIVRGIR